jgi:hypothetical protein
MQLCGAYHTAIQLASIPLGRYISFRTVQKSFLGKQENKVHYQEFPNIHTSEVL